MHEFAFLSGPNFGGFAATTPFDKTTNAPFLIAGVAYDGAVTNRPGARFGPPEIRRASRMLCDATHPHFAVSLENNVADAGDLLLPNTSLEKMRAALEPQVSALAKKHHCVWLGGDHSITLSLLRGLVKNNAGPLAILHFDAHCDTWQDHFGEPSGHGTWVYEAIQEGLIDPKATIQIGIRSAGAQSDIAYVRDMGGSIWTARELRGLENPRQLHEVLADIHDRLVGRPCYLSLDIDCLDPAFAPGTGTPEPGGMTSNQVLTILEETADLNWIGMDVCEVSPPYDHAQLTSNAAAVFAWTYLCGQIAKRTKSKE
jgi:agmatinase